MTNSRYVNLFQADSNFETLNPHPSLTVNFRCPHCLNNGAFQAVSQGYQYFKRVGDNSGKKLQAVIRLCPNQSCKGIVFTLGEMNGEKLIVLPPELIDFDADHLPHRLLETLKEAIACQSVGAYRAAAMMVRRLLEEICDDSDAYGNNLYARLEALKEKITLPNELFDAMGELKALGNDAAHVEAKNYSQIGQGEAADSIELAKEILKARYQLKGLVERLRARKIDTGQ